MIVDILLKEREKELNTMPRAKPLLILGRNFSAITTTRRRKPETMLCCSFEPIRARIHHVVCNVELVP